jgi:hypothetical protein
MRYNKIRYDNGGGGGDNGGDNDVDVDRRNWLETK